MVNRLYSASAGALLLLSLPCLLLAQGGFSGPGAYEIMNAKSGRVIDLDRNDQSTVIQFSSRGTDNQAWVIESAGAGCYFIRNSMNGFALDAPDNRNSSPLRGTPFNGSPSQQWRIESGREGQVLIVNRMSNKVIDVPDGAARDGLRLQIYDANGESNQRFMLRPLRGEFGRGWRGGAGRRSEGPRPGNIAPAGVYTVVCSSNDGSRVYCNADTSGAVRMTRQISGSPCTEGRTWGAGSRGIWVDRGCRAEFETVPGQRRGPMGAEGGQRRGGPPVVVCASDNGRRVFCDADTRNGVRLVRQLGGRCVEGESWGSSNRGIWVDRGCRAEFMVGR
jgi:hypothetical protein